MSVTVDRVRLHQLVDALRERDLDTVHHMLRGLLGLDGDPVLNALLNAPEDDEPVTTRSSPPRLLIEDRLPTQASARHRDPVGAQTQRGFSSLDPG